MPPGAVQIVANGLSTDHPVPGLAFVNDSHIPVDDPNAIESIGRNAGRDRWGRCDDGPLFGPDEQRQWWAFTTEPDGTDLAWSVRYHPRHGRSVLLLRNEDKATLHSDWHEDDSEPLLFRSGGYWWDGKTWHRPMQVFDYAAQRYARRRVAGAWTITAAAMLAAADDAPTSAAVLTIADVHRAAAGGDRIQPMIVQNWSDHLRLWAGRRRSNAPPLSECVVGIGAPELAADQLIGTAEMAALAGIAPSTLRAYLARGENDLPAHQAVIGGRNLWSRPVGADWVESRRRLPDSVAAALAVTSELSVGQADLQERFTDRFLNRLWASPFRKQWRLGDEETARQRAGELASVVATNLGDIIPTDALKYTIYSAVLRGFQDSIATAATINGGVRPDNLRVWISRPTAVMLDWIVRHHPTRAATLINDIIGNAERELKLPRAASIASIRRALADGKLSANEYDIFLDRVLPPTTE
jgi:hypothetical protein